MGTFGVESTFRKRISNLSFCICYPRNNSHCQYKNRFSYYQKCNPIPKWQTRDIFCEMCDIPPHVINILESEYVLFADPPKYYITMCTIYNDWAGWKILFCFLFSKYACFCVICNVDGTNQCTCLTLLWRSRARAWI